MAIAKPIPVPVNNRYVLLGSKIPGAPGNKLRNEFSPSIMKARAKSEVGTMIFQDGIPVRLRPISI